MSDPTIPRHSILVVDDDPIVQAIIERMLARAGYRVLMAGDADEALAVLAAEPTIVVATLDQHLPNMGGIELIELMRDRHPTVRTIVISGRRLPELSTPGPDRFLPKPFREVELLGALEELSAVAMSMRAVHHSSSPP